MTDTPEVRHSGHPVLYLSTQTMSLSPTKLPLCYVFCSPYWRRRPLGTLQMSAMGKARIFSTTWTTHNPNPWQHLGLPDYLSVAQVSLLDNSRITVGLNIEHLQIDRVGAPIRRRLFDENKQLHAHRPLLYRSR